MELEVSCIGMGYADKKVAVQLMQEHLEDDYEEFISHFTFVPDTENEYDPNAVAILWHPDINGKLSIHAPHPWDRSMIVGFVPMAEHEDFYDYMAWVNRQENGCVRIDVEHIQHHAKIKGKINSMKLKVSKV